MEAIHKSRSRSWIDRPVINVEEFKKQWSSTSKFKSSCKLEESSVCVKGFIEEEYDEIAKQCGLETMRCDYQGNVEISSSLVIPDDVKLDTLRWQKEELDKKKSDPKYTAMIYNSQKFCNFPPHENLGACTGVDNIPFDSIKLPEVILSVQVYMPERRVESSAKGKGKMPNFQMDSEFLVLGCQFLTELRDKIECVSDQAISGDLSDCPNVKPTVTCKDLYKSGFFYINGIFYNDMRDKASKDYSEVIIKWAEQATNDIGPFKKAIMENTRFVELSIQLGYPYVYVHQGYCEHLLVFSELRMFTNHEICNKEAYPLYVAVKPSKRIFCMTCHAFSASWVVCDNPRLPENPFFFCKLCFSSFNYDENGEKIGSFRAYHFPDRTKLK